jgi:molecular chaperone GrpE
MSEFFSEITEPDADVEFPSRPEPIPDQVPETDEGAVPRLGLLDVIEAFTAMRHEWRGQTRESRALATAVESAADRICQLDEKLVAGFEAAADAAGNEVAQGLAEAIVEIDVHLSRAIDAAVSATSSRDETDLASQRQAVRDLFAKQNFIRRWFCRPFLQGVLRVMEEAQARRAVDPTSEGLQLLVTRVRRLLSDQRIDRLETLGMPFDAEKMNAIEAIHAAGRPRGHVIEQLSPAYAWRGRLLRYAEVRISR